MLKEYSMKSKNRRVHQRWLNKYICWTNDGIRNDPLWLGRFIVDQVSTSMEWFGDKSGGLMSCHLRFRDKKTGITRDWYTDCLDLQYNMYFKMNDFIIKDCKVWEKEKPYEEKQDYRNIR